MSAHRAMRGALRGFHVSKQLAKESSIETPSLGGSRIHSAVLTAGLNRLPEKCRNEENPSLSGSRRSDLADFIAQPKLCSFKAAEFLGKLGSRAQNGARGLLLGESSAESCGQAGGGGASFLLCGEPGLRWVGGVGFFAGCGVGPKMEQEEYFRVNRERNCVDGRSVGGGENCLLWGEPGLRCVGGVVFFRHPSLP